MRNVIDYLGQANETTRLRFANYVWKSALESVEIDSQTGWQRATQKPIGTNSNADMQAVNNGYAQLISIQDVSNDVRDILNDARHLWYWVMQRIGKDEILDTVETANGGRY